MRSLLSTVIFRHAINYGMSVLLCLDTTEVCEGRVALGLWKLKLLSLLAFACSLEAKHNKAHDIC